VSGQAFFFRVDEVARGYDEVGVDIVAEFPNFIHSFAFFKFSRF